MDMSEIFHGMDGNFRIYIIFIEFCLVSIPSYGKKRSLSNLRAFSRIHSSQSAFGLHTQSYRTENRIAMKKIHSIFIDLLFSAILKFLLQIFFIFSWMFYYKRDSPNPKMP